MNKEFYFRGVFMSLFIDIEYILSDILSDLLVTNKSDKTTLMEFITPSILLDKKIILINKLLKRKNKSKYNTYKNDFEELRNLVGIRNDFAHKRIEIDATKKQLHFIKIENNLRQKGSHSFNDLDDKCKKLKNILKNINEL